MINPGTIATEVGSIKVGYIAIIVKIHDRMAIRRVLAWYDFDTGRVQRLTARREAVDWVFLDPIPNQIAWET